jgi:hypothetical protein
MEIQRGDDAFASYDYRIALGYYRIAKEKLRRAYLFEKESPKSRDKVLQDYYNRERFIDTRLELTAICLKLRKDDYPLNPDIHPKRGAHTVYSANYAVK